MAADPLTTVGSGVLLAGAVAVGWIAASTLLVLAGRLPGAAGRAASLVARRVAPVALRGALEATLGVAVVVAATPARAEPPPPVPAADDRMAPVLGPPLPFDWTDLVTPSPATVLADLDDVFTTDPSAPGMVLESSAPPPALPSSVAPARERRGVTTSPAGAEAAASAARPTVVVSPGDTLWSIAAAALGDGATAADIDAEWRRWYAANRALIGGDPGLIHPGQRLGAPLPDAAAGRPPTAVAASTGRAR